MLAIQANKAKEMRQMNWRLFTDRLPPGSVRIIVPGKQTGQLLQ